MAKINITTLNMELTPWNNTKSNKNLTSDNLKDIAEAVGFDVRYLCEEFNTAIGYLFEESDVSIIKEMIDLSKTKEGRKARCKVYDKETCDVIARWIEIFVELAKHNGVGAELAKQLKVKMFKKTDYIVLKRKVEVACPQIAPCLYSTMFVPTDSMPDDDDKLTATDAILFLEFIMGQSQLSKSEMCGLYWCFVEMRDSKINEDFVNGLHEMDKDEKEHMFKNVKERVHFEGKLDNNPGYVSAMQELARIEGGQGKLQDKKKIRPLIKSIAEIMDKEADGVFDSVEYTKGITNIPTKVEAIVTIEDEFAESREVFAKAIGWYNGLAKERFFTPVNERNENMLEMGYRSRFGEYMFAR